MKSTYQENLKFDRKARCDWCGRKQTVSICHYGTTHYNRLVCPTCAKNINEHEKIFGRQPYFNPDNLKIN